MSKYFSCEGLIFVGCPEIKSYKVEYLKVRSRKITRTQKTKRLISVLKALPDGRMYRHDNSNCVFLNECEMPALEDALRKSGCAVNHLNSAPAFTVPKLDFMPKFYSDNDHYRAMAYGSFGVTSPVRSVYFGDV